MTKKKILEDVVIIRLALIVLLVLYHAFAIFNGAWEKPTASFPDIRAYWWIATTSYSFMLEAFVFISGYVFGHQVCRKGRGVLSFQSLIVKKAKRLLLPCLFFSVVYYLLFYDLHKPVGQIFYTIANGCGHLWFLPMLFWCFVAIYVIEKIRLKAKLLFPLLILCSLCSFLPLPFRLGNTLYYFVFFYVGYWCSCHKAAIVSYIRSAYVKASVGAFVVAFISLTYISKSGGGKLYV